MSTTLDHDKLTFETDNQIYLHVSFFQPCLKVGVAIYYLTTCSGVASAHAGHAEHD